MKKRGLSGVIVSVLTILLLLFAVALIWLVVKPLISSSGEKAEIEQELMQVRLTIPKKYVTTTENKISFVVERQPGGGEISGILIVLEDKDKTTESTEIDNPLAEFQTYLVKIEHDTINLAKILIYTVKFTETGRKIISPNPAAVYYFSGESATPEEKCGNEVRDEGEVCDSIPQDCITDEGYSGTQQCNSNCDGWKECNPTEFCGDNIINGNEECDGTEGCNENCLIETTELTECKIIEEAGVYELTTDISLPPEREICFEITADDVTINGNAFTISSDSTGTAIKAESVSNIVIENLDIGGFNNGIKLNSVTTALINEINIVTGFVMGDSGGIILTESSNIEITNNDLECDSFYGAVYIGGGGSNEIRSNTFTGSTWGAYIVNSNENIISENNMQAESAGNGIYLSHSNNNQIISNTINSAIEGLRLDYVENNLFSANTMCNSIYMDVSCTDAYNNQQNIQNKYSSSIGWTCDLLGWAHQEC